MNYSAELTHLPRLLPLLVLPISLKLVAGCPAQLPSLPLEQVKCVAVQAEPGGATSTRNLERELADVRERIIRKRGDVEKVQNDRKRLESVELERLPDVIKALGVENETVTTTIRELRESRLKKAGLSGSGIGAEHPAVKSLRAKEKAYLDVLTEELESIRRGKKTELMLEESQLQNLETRQKELEDQMKKLREKAPKPGI